MDDQPQPTLTVKAPDPFRWIRENHHREIQATRERLYSLREAARALEVCTLTLHRWGKRGLIQFTRPNPRRGWIKISEAEITRLRAGRPLLKERA